jgi:hypothetical protein
MKSRNVVCSDTWPFVIVRQPKLRGCARLSNKYLVGQKIAGYCAVKVIHYGYE